MSRSRTGGTSPAVLAVVLCALLSPPARADDPAAVEFFEKEVRPILAERCQGCHGAAKQKGGLRLDARASVLAGGNSGPAVVPGKPAESLLVDAINYGDIVQMPPKSKLPKPEIDALTRWVVRGAPWPAGDATTKPTKAAPGGGIDLAERAKHWSFRPIRDPRPPVVKDTAWPLNPIDRFLLATLEAKGIAPAPEADRRSLIRRVTFDLTGLPPSPAEVEAFVGDDAADAYERLVDRLLASPRYGERWARHWLDLVRYGETAGHEFDYDSLDAWRYRDYVVRAFNEDVPYDQFVVEHLAGDLLENPRRAADGSNESILGTGFFLLGEGTHSPVDVRDDAAARADNQIDVLGKTFLGLTLACARCHDHKFDPIRQADYYALVGFLRSSRHQHAFIDPPGRLAPTLDALAALKDRIGSSVRGAASCRGEPIVAADLKTPDAPPLVQALASVADATPDAFADRRVAAIAAIRARSKDGSVLFESFDGPTFEGWTATGVAFGAGPSGPGAFRVGAGEITPIPAGLAHSGLAADRLQGVLRSRSFTIEKKYILYRAAGRGGRVNVVVDGFEKIRDPIYGVLTFGVDHGDRLRWVVQDVGMWIGHRAYIELGDGATVNYTGAPSTYFPGDGYLAVDEIRFADQPTPPAPGGRTARTLLEASSSPTDLPARLAREADEALRAWREQRPDDPERAGLVPWLVATGRVRLGELPSGAIAEYRAIAGTIPPPTLAPALIDGTGEDARLQIRGSTKTLGAAVPRRFLEVFAGANPPAPSRGSGRLDLARRVLDPSNPLVARVLVNRLWKHHFGDGLVATPDDFGRMGRPPSNPELLDWLATEFVREGWSIKPMQRRIVTSRAYRMSSRPEPEAERLDPANVLLHRMNVRRLEAEAIRDAMLAVSGRLDSRMSGPPVPVHLTPFMDGRGRPSHSGPLDGDGRRSLYINVRRNFLPPMLLAFDFPPPATTMGRRNVSNVPAQALTLLNDPFVRDQARRWAGRVLAEGPSTPEARIDCLYRAAFSRPPEPREVAAALAFLTSRGRDDPAAWAELCHVLLNVKDFIFIN